MNPAATTTNQDPAVFGIERLMGLKEWARDHGMSAALEEQPGVLTMWDDEVHVTIYAGTEEDPRAAAVALDQRGSDAEQVGEGAAFETYEGALEWLREVTGATDPALVDTADADDTVVATGPVWDAMSAPERMALLVGYLGLDEDGPISAEDSQAWDEVRDAARALSEHDMAFLPAGDLQVLCMKRVTL